MEDSWKPSSHRYRYPDDTETEEKNVLAVMAEAHLDEDWEAVETTVYNHLNKNLSELFEGNFPISTKRTRTQAWVALIASRVVEEPSDAVEPDQSGTPDFIQPPIDPSADQDYVSDLPPPENFDAAYKVYDKKKTTKAENQPDEESTVKVPDTTTTIALKARSLAVMHALFFMPGQRPPNEVNGKTFCTPWLKSDSTFATLLAKAARSGSFLIQNVSCSREALLFTAHIRIPPFH